MILCLNPVCDRPQNPDHTEFCQNCGTKLLPLLRNRYHILRPLGDGGFGRTFLAEDIDKLKELCVVKQLAPQVQGTTAQRKATELFEEEARRLQQLGEHPHIPTLYAYFEQDGFLYLVQQLIEGQTLRQELEINGTFSEEKIWSVLRELLPVLKFVHEHQVIHRDIKPANIIRRSPSSRSKFNPEAATQGDLVLIDFGVAKHLTPNTLEKTGTSIGSYGFAPIEQMRHGFAAPNSDLFSLGVTCWYLLTGIHPSTLWAEQGYGWVAHWREYLKAPISQPLEQLLDRLLQNDLERRYQSAAEVLEQLNYQPQPSLPTVTQDITEIRPIPTSVSQLEPRELTVTQAPPSRLSMPESTIPPRETVPSTTSRRSQLLMGAAVLLVGVGGYVGWQWLGSNQTLRGHTGEVNTLALSRNGTTLISGSDDKTVKVWDVNSRRVVRTLPGHTAKVYAVAISPDGQTVASGSGDRTIKVWNLNTGKQIRTLTSHQAAVNTVAINSGGDTLVSGSDDKTIKVWNLQTGQLLRTLSGHSKNVFSVAISPDGQKLVSGSADRTVKEWDLRSGKEIRTLPGHLGDVNAVAISPDGQAIASASDDKTVRLWNFNTGSEIRPLIGHKGDVNAVTFIPGRDAIATGSDDKTIRIWNLETGEDEVTWKQHSGKIYAVTFSPNNTTLISASADKTIRLWQLPNHNEQ